MISVDPQGSIYLCKTPLENDYKNQLTFANISAQSSYFASTVAKTFTDYNYVRKDGYIVVDAPIDTIRDCNYLFYNNTGFSNRTYYCFISKMEYVSENSTRIYLETDCFQTYYFDIEYNPCFVEREHTNDDTIGSNTVPENLETGEYKIADTKQYSAKLSDLHFPAGYTYEGGNFLIGFQLSEVLGSMYVVANTAQKYNGVFSGLNIVAVDNPTDAKEFIAGYDSEGKGDAIVSIFITYPHFFDAGYAQPIGTHGHSVQRLYPCKVSEGLTVLESIEEFARPTSFGSYVPKNNKLFTYPYSYIQVNNYGGITTKMNIEDFYNATPKFTVKGAVGQGNAIKLIPVDYKLDIAMAMNSPVYEYGVTGSKLPVCGWASDYYLNWQTQNAMNVFTGIGNAAIGGFTAGAMMPAGLASGVALGAVNTLQASFSALAQVHQAEIMPDTAKGDTTSCLMNVGAGLGYTGFAAMHMQVREEYARIIDDYFTKYGYKTNRLKVPSITGRVNWNFVKTIDCGFDGDIPQDDLRVIRSIFDNGCTFWHNPSTIYDYSQNNNII